MLVVCHRYEKTLLKPHKNLKNDQESQVQMFLDFQKKAEFSVLAIDN